MRKIVLVIERKLLKFEAEGREFAIFGDRMFFQLVPGGFSFKFKLEKNIGI